jgi:hypothetical protein
VALADSGLHKHRVRQGAGYVRTQGYAEAYATFSTKSHGGRFHEGESKYVAEVPGGWEQKGNEAEREALYLIWEATRDELS